MFVLFDVTVTFCVIDEVAVVGVVDDVDELEGILTFLFVLMIVEDDDLIRFRVRIVVMLLGRQVCCIVFVLGVGCSRSFLSVSVVRCCRCGLFVVVSSLVLRSHDRVFSASVVSCFVD